MGTVQLRKRRRKREMRENKEMYRKTNQKRYRRK
jgi:hypothetical protein